MAKYIPAKSYIGSSEVATDFNVTGPSTLSNTLTVGVDDTGHDVKFFGATSGRYLLWDESDNNLEFVDNVKAVFGSSGGLEVFKDGTNSYLRGWGGDIIIENNADDKDIIFKSDDGSGGVTAYLTLDGSAGEIKFYKTLSNQANVNLVMGGGQVKFNDSGRLYMGDSNDLQIYHNATNSYIANGTGDLYIQCSANDKDIIFQSDDGSGGVETYFFLDGSTGYTSFPDGKILGFGAAGDLSLQHDGNNSYINANGTGDLIIKQMTDDKDISFQCDDGSGGTTAYLTLDGSATNMKVAKDMRFNDSVDAEFGTSGDFKIYHDGSNTYLEQINAGTGNIVISNANDDADIILQSDDGSGGVTAYITLDGSRGFTTAQKNIRMGDSIELELGTDGDGHIIHTGSAMEIENNTGDLTINQEQNDGDIIFLCDNGSGGTTSYLTLDGGNVSVNILTQKVIMANLPTSDPAVNGQLWNDSGTLKVSAGE